jgi:hypothetical protein
MDAEYVARDAIVCPARFRFYQTARFRFYQTARFRFYQTCHSEERSDEESAAPLRLARNRFLTSFGMKTINSE